MRAEQPTSLCKPQRKMKVKVGAPQKTGLNPSPSNAGHPKAVLSLRFYLSLCAVVC